MRIYDARVAKFLSVDPIGSRYPFLTPYQFASNTPIQSIDLDGLEQYKVKKMYYYSTSSGNAVIKVTIDFNRANVPGIGNSVNYQRFESSPGANDPDRKADIFINNRRTIHQNWPTEFGFIPSVENAVKRKVTDPDNINLGTQDLPLSQGKDFILFESGTKWRYESVDYKFKLTNKFFYGTNEAVDAVASESLKNYVNVLLSNPELTAKLIGNTSRLGSSADNVTLATNRINDVITLIKNVAKTDLHATDAQVDELLLRITPIPSGESNSTNPDGSDINADRNVELKINIPEGSEETP